MHGLDRKRFHCFIKFIKIPDFIKDFYNFIKIFLKDIGILDII